MFCVPSRQGSDQSVVALCCDKIPPQLAKPAQHALHLRQSSSRRTMAFKAWSYSTPGYPACLSLNPIDLPHPPKVNEIHIRVQAAALNPVDIQLMNLPI